MVKAGEECVLGAALHDQCRLEVVFVVNYFIHGDHAVFSLFNYSLLEEQMIEEESEDTKEARNTA